jgi:hypothetical protein
MLSGVIMARAIDRFVFGLACILTYSLSARCPAVEQDSPPPATSPTTQSDQNQKEPIGFLQLFLRDRALRNRQATSLVVSIDNLSKTKYLLATSPYLNVITRRPDGQTKENGPASSSRMKPTSNPTDLDKMSETWVKMVVMVEVPYDLGPRDHPGVSFNGQISASNFMPGERKLMQVGLSPNWLHPGHCTIRALLYDHEEVVGESQTQEFDVVGN